MSLPCNVKACSPNGLGWVSCSQINLDNVLQSKATDTYTTL